MSESGLFPMLFQQLWQVTLLIVVVLAVQRVLCKSRPHLAYVLWLLVLLKCLTPPIVSSSGSVFTWMQPIRQVKVADTTNESRLNSQKLNRHHFVEYSADDSRTNSQRDLFANGNDSIERLLEADLQATNGADSRAALFKAGDQAPLSAPGRRPPGLAITVMAVWLFGIVVWAMIGCIRTILCLRRIYRNQVSTSPELQRHLNLLADRMDIGHQVGIVVTRSQVGPAVIGILRPRIVLPEVLLEGGGLESLTPILAHELTHIKRKDVWFAGIQWVAQVLWWFHPLVWLSNRMATRQVERCCDEQTIGMLGLSNADYARGLLSVLETKNSLQPVASFPGVRPVELTTNRLERIMMLGQGCRRRTPYRYWLVLLASAWATLPGASSQEEVFEKNSQVQEETNESAEAEQKFELASQTVAKKEVPFLSNLPYIGRVFSRYERNVSADAIEFNADGLVKEVVRRHQVEETAAKEAVLNVLRGNLNCGELHWVQNNTLLLMKVSDPVARRQIVELLKNEIEFLTENKYRLVMLRATVLEFKKETSDALFVESEVQPTRLTESERRPTNVDIKRVPENERAAFREQMQSLARHAEIRQLSVPSLVTMPDLECRVFLGKTHPYVAGFEGKQPVIEEIDSGIEIKATPRLRDGGVQLELRVQTTWLDEMLSQQVAGQEEQFIQVPTTVVRRVSTGQKLTPGDTLVLSNLKASATDSDKRLIVLLELGRLVSWFESYQEPTKDSKLVSDFFAEPFIANDTSRTNIKNGIPIEQGAARLPLVSESPRFPKLADEQKLVKYDLEAWVSEFEKHRSGFRKAAGFDQRLLAMNRNELAKEFAQSTVDNCMPNQDYPFCMDNMVLELTASQDLHQKVELDLLSIWHEMNSSFQVQVELLQMPDEMFEELLEDKRQFQLSDREWRFLEKAIEGDEAVVRVKVDPFPTGFVVPRNLRWADLVANQHNIVDAGRYNLPYEQLLRIEPMLEQIDFDSWQVNMKVKLASLEEFRKAKPVYYVSPATDENGVHQADGIHTMIPSPAYTAFEANGFEFRLSPGQYQLLDVTERMISVPDADDTNLLAKLETMSGRRAGFRTLMLISGTPEVADEIIERVVSEHKKYEAASAPAVRLPKASVKESANISESAKNGRK